MTPPLLRAAVPAASAGGALGSLARWRLTEWLPDTSGFPTTVFWINVVGAGMLASLPLLGVVRRSPWLGVFLGTGVLGGFTTMSAASAETFLLLEDGDTLTAAGYAGGTLAGALLAAWLVSQWTTPAQRVAMERDGADE